MDNDKSTKSKRPKKVKAVESVSDKLEPCDPCDRNLIRNIIDFFRYKYFLSQSPRDVELSLRTQLPDYSIELYEGNSKASNLLNMNIYSVVIDGTSRYTFCYIKVFATKTKIKDSIYIVTPVAQRVATALPHLVDYIIDEDWLCVNIRQHLHHSIRAIYDKTHSGTCPTDRSLWTSLFHKINDGKIYAFEFTTSMPNVGRHSEEYVISY